MPLKADNADYRASSVSQRAGPLGFLTGYFVIATYLGSRNNALIRA
jgi:hypothetical protein